MTLLQYVEDMTDRQAAEAVRERIDWKYLLGLELSDPGFDASVLTEWRERLLAQGAEERLLEVSQVNNIFTTRLREKSINYFESRHIDPYNWCHISHC